MVLLHPWLFAAGAAAVSLPVAVHFLTRPRPVKMPLSTIRFVMEAVQQKRAKYRLRDWLILLLRASAVALLAWAFARPMMGAKPLVHVGDSGRAVRVVVLDESQSMAATSRGTTAFERARTIADKYVAYQSDLRADLLLAAAKPNAVFEAASMNFGALREALASAKPRAERLDVQAALNRAGDVLAKTPTDAADVRRELVIVSDFQRSSWASADFSVIPKETLIQFESVAPSQTPGNLAVLNVRAPGRVEQFHDARIEVEIGNYSMTPRDVRVELRIGEATYPLAGSCPPHIATTLTADVSLKDAGWVKGMARLVEVDDALAADNSRFFTLNVRSSPVYALITREPAKPQPSSSHYLERALAPIPAREHRGGERVIPIDPAAMNHEQLGQCDVIVLDHPGKLTAAQVELLSGMMRRGRGIFSVAAESADVANLKMIADAAGADLKMPVEFAPSRAQENLFIAEWRKDQAPFNALGDELSAAIAPLRFSGTLASHRTPAGLPDDILASYSDRSAALVITRCGAGMLAVLNVDLTQSDLAGSALFVPLVSEITSRLMIQRERATAACGEPVAAFLPAEASPAEGLHVVMPKDVTADPGTLSEDASAIIWRIPSAGPPGVYEVRRGASTVFALASAIPASEADLQTMDPAILKTRLASGRHVAFTTADNDEPANDTAWSWSLVGCAACVLAELALLKVLSA
jgi:hypothetical protein